MQRLKMIKNNVPIYFKVFMNENIPKTCDRSEFLCKIQR